jgi:hypothetical protein
MFNRILSLLSWNKKSIPTTPSKPSRPRKKKIESTRIGELGEYKINIQLDQLPRDCKYVSDIMIQNQKSTTGYSQIDHAVISPYGLFIIETKNYNGKIKGSREDTYWTVNGRFKMYNPLKQNYGHIKALESILTGYPFMTYISIISFTMRCRFSIDPELRKIESNELVVYDVELSEFMNRKILRMKSVSNQTLLNDSQITDLYTIISSANITDPLVRAEHIEKIKR